MSIPAKTCTSSYSCTSACFSTGAALQAVSSRPDVTPPDYLKELEKLQDQIPAFDSREAMRVMENDLGFPPSRLFSTLATEPTAAASLGQVSPIAAPPHC